MATQGILNTSSWTSNYGYTRYVEFAWQRTAFDVANQTSTIKWTLTGRGTFTGQVKCAPFLLYIDGETVYSSDARISLYPEQVIASGTKVIKHNTDGTKTFSVNVQAAIYTSAINKTGSGTFTLDLVGRANITKAPNFNDEENPTIEYENPVGNAISSLQAAISLTGETPDIAYRDIAITGGSYTFNLTDAERKVLRAATQGANTRKIRFYLRNVIDGNIYFSWKEANFTVINANPTISASVIDTNATTVALTGDSSTLIRYHSTAKASFAATAYKEATIKTNVIEHNGSLTSNNSLVVVNTGSNVFSFIAADSRGNTANETIVSPMIDYITPTANLDNTELMETTGRYMLKCSGNYYNDTFGYTDAAAANTLAVRYRYKTQGGNYGSWFAMVANKSGNTYAATAAISGLDYRETYVFQCQVADKLNIITSAEMVVRSLPVFHWSETDFTFEVPVNFNAGANGLEDGSTNNECSIVDGVYNGDLNIVGNLRMKGSGNYGNTIYFGDSSYAYITETTDDDITIKATDINLNGNVYVNGTALTAGGSTSGGSGTSGNWTPTLTAAGAVASYTTRQGWYSWVGNVITIGFNIKATINSGYSSTNVQISGLPFFPSYSAFGGGIAHNVAFTAGHCFEGWAVNEDGIISLRGQPCNNTTQTNLNITSTAYYPTGSGTVMTLAGTICFTSQGAG